MIRDFKIEDLPALKKIHENFNLDYALPDLRSPLWVVTKVLEVDGSVRAALGAWVQVELYLLLDNGPWADPKQKLEALKELDRQTIDDLYWLKGIDQACLWLPPNMERFGKRLEKDFGFTKDRDGWVVYSKMTERKK
jgi:hypothetical protein